jgi:ferredoxin
MTRIYIDKTRCEGTQLCVGTYPQAFVIGDDGCAEIIDEGWSSTVSDDELESLITLCPTDAIRRVRQEG